MTRKVRKEGTGKTKKAEERNGVSSWEKGSGRSEARSGVGLVKRGGEGVSVG